MKKIEKFKFCEIPDQLDRHCNATTVSQGLQFIPQQQILFYSADEWERFVEEWAYSKKDQYRRVVRPSGANDKGIDVAGFIDDDGFEGKWDNYQCKHYKKSLMPTNAIPEIGKIIWHCYKKSYTPPQKYYFVAPKDCGRKLKLLLDKTDNLNDFIY